MAIQSFKNKEILHFYETGIVPKRAPWHNLSKVVLRKLDLLNSAYSLEDLRIPPSNRLESLRGDLNGVFSIRINDQWRIIFIWTKDGSAQVAIIDYHF